VSLCRIAFVEVMFVYTCNILSLYANTYNSYLGVTSQESNYNFLPFREHRRSKTDATNLNVPKHVRNRLVLTLI